jgi:hypothetical protein
VALRSLPTRWLLLLLLALPGACGGGGLSHGRFRDDEASYRVGPVGDRWKRLSVDDQNDLAWHHGPSGSIIQVNASCDPAMDVPLKALTAHLLIGFTERRMRSEQLRTLDAREALQTHLVAKLDGVPRELLLTVLKKDGCVYDFSLVAPPGAGFTRARASYDSLLSGFRTR